MKRISLVLLGALTLGDAHAFGLMDVFSAGVSVVGKVGGAVIDKAMEDSPEELAAKQAKEKADLDAKFKEAVAKVESNPDMKLLEKERAVRQIAKTFGMAETINNLAAQQEIARREQRDKTLTLGGIAGVAGNAAMNTPSMAMARADMAVASGQQQAQSRSTLAQTDALLQTGQVQNKNRASVAAADTLLKGGAPQQSSMSVTDVQSAVANPVRQAQIANAIQNSADQHKPEMDAAKAAIEAAKPIKDFGEQEPVSLLAQDKGRKIFVEFLNGKLLSERLRSAFKDGGYKVVDNVKNADVVYQFDGEYTIEPAYEREGLTEQLGVLSDNPHVIELPQRKVSAMKSALGGLLSAVSGQGDPTTRVTTYRQQVLLVANRHFEGKDIRVSALSAKEGMSLKFDILIQEAMQEIVEEVGIHAVQLASSGVAVPNVSH